VDEEKTLKAFNIMQYQAVFIRLLHGLFAAWIRSKTIAALEHLILFHHDHLRQYI